MAGELNDIVARLEPSLGPRAGEARELDGGITNRNYRVTLGELDYVVRLPGKDTELLGIDRRAELLANEAAAALGIAPGVAAVLDGCIVTRFLACRAPAPGELAGEARALALALRAFHDSPARLPTCFSVPTLLEDYAAIVAARGGELPRDYGAARRAAARIAAALGAVEERPCHNDLLPGNVVLSDGRVMLVDWEYAGTGDARFDLGNVSVNNGFDEAAEERLLSAYDGERPTDARRAALALMRVMSDAREAAWGVVQGAISALEFDFGAYAAEHFERLRAAIERPDFEERLACVSADRDAAAGRPGRSRGQAA